MSAVTKILCGIGAVGGLSLAGKSYSNYCSEREKAQIAYSNFIPARVLETTAKLASDRDAASKVADYYSQQMAELLKQIRDLQHQYDNINKDYTETQAHMAQFSAMNQKIYDKVKVAKKGEKLYFSRLRSELEQQYREKLAEQLAAAREQYEGTVKNIAFNLHIEQSVKEADLTKSVVDATLEQ